MFSEPVGCRGYIGPGVCLSQAFTLFFYVFLVAEVVDASVDPQEIHDAFALIGLTMVGFLGMRRGRSGILDVLARNCKQRIGRV